ncbi:methionine-gamma-lyase [Haloactinospora alba]|uniref:homocysteine desulfhydrase n=1 Tax=Haloactinospora alba TaxID=405555 RepID=A0A543N919_9ACTN|nr:aminotransferase class I/II-fold pyridoxal phosphate-dependent enzyme [Haloactinospora alba]TQN28323.1 methionine-gamma-lyase [Haloactinospora alba]
MTTTSANPAPQPESRTVHTPASEVHGSRPVGVPIHQNHTFTFDSAEDMAAAFTGPDGAYLYARFGNPTTSALETAVADLEGGAAALASASGMGAITSTVGALVGTGDHVVAQNCLYGGTLAFLADLERRWGVEVTRVSGEDPDEVRAALRPNTRVMVLETITNPTVRVVDLSALLGIAREAGVTSVVDNTFATPMLCRPLEHGADVVIHSATKYLGGHSDAMGGVAVFADSRTHGAVREHSVESGATLDPFAAWLTIRGMQTLALRVRAQCANAQALAERLSARPEVAAVHYPGLDTHPSRETARRVLPGGCGGVLAFELAGGKVAGEAFAGALRLCVLAPSLGDVKTLVMHPASTSHRQLGSEELAEAGITPGLIRISVGIEQLDDLWGDIERALEAAAG